jgi:hypothetical protein
MATTFATSGPYIPTKSLVAGHGTNQFAMASGFSQNYVADQVIVPLPLVATSFSVTSPNLVTMTSGASVVNEVNTTGIGGIVITDTNDEIAWSFVVPWDMDPAKEFAIRFEYANRAGLAWATGTATDLITTTSYWTKWDLSTDTGALAGTVFSDTTNTASLASVAYGRQWSAWDSVNDSAVLSANPVPAEDRILGFTRFGLGSGVSSTFVIGMQLGYYKRYQA